MEFEITEKSIPTRAEVGKSVSEKIKSPLENIEIKKIASGFGSNNFKVTAFVYDSKETRMSTETKPKIIEEKKEEPVEEKKTEESTPEAPTEEAPKENVEKVESEEKEEKSD